MFLKGKRGFTLVEIIVVVALMAMISLLAVPSLRGVTTRAQKDAYNSYFLQGKDDMRNFMNLMNMGETVFPVTSSNYKVTEVDLTTAEGLTKAMNYANRQTAYQYYIIGFTESNAATNPTSKIQAAELKTDVIVPVFVKNGDVYESRGMWYYSAEKGTVVMTFKIKNLTMSDGYSSLKSTK